MKCIPLAILAALAGCANQYIPLPQVDAKDQVVVLNPGRWTATVNDLITPPELEAAASGR